MPLFLECSLHDITLCFDSLLVKAVYCLLGCNPLACSSMLQHFVALYPLNRASRLQATGPHEPRQDLAPAMHAAAAVACKAMNRETDRAILT